MAIESDIYIEELISKKNKRAYQNSVKKSSTSPVASVNIKMDENSLLQGIIYSEILGKPRCKRRHRRGW